MLLEQMIVRCVAAGLLKGQSKQRTDSTRVMAKVSVLNRVELAGETLRRGLDDIAQIAPNWLKDQNVGGAMLALTGAAIIAY